MAEYPILFSTEMVRAILDGRKTQTRRIIKPQPPANLNRCNPITTNAGVISWCFYNMKDPDFHAYKSNRYQVGDLLWVRETWWDLGYWVNKEWYGRTEYHIVKPQYCADGEPEGPIATNKRATLKCQWRKRPSIHMPKWAARIWLEITGIRVEQLQEISPKDAMFEGIKTQVHLKKVGKFRYGIGDMWSLKNAPDAFRKLWDSLYAKRGYGWDTNPWVCVREFKVLEGSK